MGLALNREIPPADDAKGNRFTASSVYQLGICISQKIIVK